MSLRSITVARIVRIATVSPLVLWMACGASAPQGSAAPRRAGGPVARIELSASDSVPHAFESVRRELGVASSASCVVVFPKAEHVAAIEQSGAVPVDLVYRDEYDERSEQRVWVDCGDDAEASAWSSIERDNRSRDDDCRLPLLAVAWDEDAERFEAGLRPGATGASAVDVSALQNAGIEGCAAELLVYTPGCESVSQAWPLVGQRPEWTPLLVWEVQPSRALPRCSPTASSF